MPEPMKAMKEMIGDDCIQRILLSDSASEALGSMSPRKSWGTTFFAVRL